MFKVNLKDILWLKAHDCILRAQNPNNEKAWNKREFYLDSLRPIDKRVLRKTIQGDGITMCGNNDDVL